MNYIKYETKSKIAYITLARAEKRNALSYEMVTELKEAFTQTSRDSEAKVVILQAEGKAFCAGADLAYLQQLQNNTFEENLEDSAHLKELFYQIYTHPKVIIAAIQGHAIAGGCGLATVCDFSISVEEAKFGYTEVKIGFIPAIVSMFLIRKIGEGKAKELLLSGDLITAQEAQNMTLINQVVNTENLQETVESLAQKLIKNNSAESMALTKQMMATIQEKSLEASLEYASEMNAKARATEDCKKGISAFLNKEKIVW